MKRQIYSEGKESEEREREREREGKEEKGSRSVHVEERKNV